MVFAFVFEFRVSMLCKLIDSMTLTSSEKETLLRGENRLRRGMGGEWEASL